MRARILRDWKGHKAGDEFDVSPRWMLYAKRQGIAEQVSNKKKTTKSTAKTEPQSDKEE